ncbi:unnamed protein product [Meganyctiphanes norvegica]|uniref:BZIP domain-containing protein n=1 Tax=Meganyctiphanes norvegica TaxID=48144 RepID=A0AAV2QHM1_MEGNR
MDMTSARMIDNPHYAGMSLKALLETTDLIDMPFAKESLEGGTNKGVLKGQDVAPYQPNAAFLGPAIWQKSELKLEYLDLDDFLNENNLHKTQIGAHQRVVNPAPHRTPVSHPLSPPMCIAIPPHPEGQQTPMHYLPWNIHGYQNAKTLSDIYQHPLKERYHHSPDDVYETSPKDVYQNSPKDTSQDPPDDSYQAPQKDDYLGPAKEGYLGSPKEAYQASPGSSPARPMSSPVIVSPRVHNPAHDATTYNQQHDMQSPHKMERSNGIPRMINVPYTLNPSELALATLPGEDFDPRTRAFTDDELKPQPMIRKSGKQFVAPDMKDDKYWTRRTKNNIAAKRSRDARRLKENQIAMRANFLEKENKTMKREIANQKLVIGSLKKRLSEYEVV